MELLFVTVIGAGLGLILRYAVPGHDRYGVLLLPCLAASVTAAVWVVSLWAGLTFDGGWIWVISLAAAVAASLAVAMLLPRRRDEADRRELDRLLGTRA